MTVRARSVSRALRRRSPSSAWLAPIGTPADNGPIESQVPIWQSILASRSRGFAFTRGLNASTNVDTINDFAVDDTIRLSKAIFAALPTGTLAAAAFASNTTGIAGDASDRIIYETDTGKIFYVMNTHNASDVHGRAWRKRRVAVRRQVRELAKLHRRGATVFFTGDMNERAQVHCAVTKTRRFKAASGGSVGRRCSVPKINGIDWIFGTRDVEFTRWVSDKTPRTLHISDHSLVIARARIRR